MRTKHRADSCCRRLERKGIKAAAIHGNRSQAQRERALSAFRDGTVDVLVATDVLARGIDISDVRYVVNFDVPAEPTDYIHRIGRTGRAGELGWAITFVTEQDVDEFYEIEKLMDKTADIYEAGDLHVGPNPPAVDPERDPAAFKVKKTKRGKSKSKKKLEQARRDGKRNGDDYGDVAGRSNRGRDERGGKTRVREGVQARVDEAVESVAREVAAEERAGAVEQGPRGNRAERRAKQFQGEAHRRRREDEDRGGRRRVEREDEGRGSRGGKRGSGDRRRSGRDGERGGRDERRGGEGRGSRDERGTRGGKRFDERGGREGGRGGERREGARGNGGRSGAGRSGESRDRRDPRASRDRRDDWRNYDDPREERRGGYRGGRGGNRGGSSRRPGDGGGKRK